MGKEIGMELLFRIMLAVAEREGEGTNLVSPWGEDKWWSLWEETFNVESPRFSVQSMNTKKARWDLKETPFFSLVLDPLFVSHLFQLSAFSTYSALSKKKKNPARSLCCFVFSHRAAKTYLTTHRCPLLAQDVHSSLFIAQQFHSACNRRSITIYVCCIHQACSWNIHNNESCTSGVGELINNISTVFHPFDVIFNGILVLNLNSPFVLSSRLS